MGREEVGGGKRWLNAGSKKFKYVKIVVFSHDFWHLLDVSGSFSRHFDGFGASKSSDVVRRLKDDVVPFVYNSRICQRTGNALTL